jgi:DNA-binding LacI/PurR family transcriptional regulator
VLSGLRQLGWHVPKDISVCSFGDAPMAQVAAPAFTTVHTDLRELGSIGAHKLLAQLHHEQVPSLEVLPTTIIERDTTAELLSPWMSAGIQSQNACMKS